MYATVAIILVLWMSPQAISSFLDILSDAEINETLNSSFVHHRNLGTSGSCQEDACLNGGKCNRIGLCECHVFSYGARCEQVNCNEFYPECEASGGKCKLPKVTYMPFRIPYCDCPEPKLYNILQRQCVDGVNEERCSNGGSWVYNNRCSCRYGTSGERCEIIDDCQTGKMCSTGKDVECVYMEILLLTYCQCKDTSKAFNYTEKACKSILGSCKEDACLNGGHCNEKGLCECRDYSYGARCEHVYCKQFYPGCEASGGQCKLKELQDTYTWIPYCDCPEPKLYNILQDQCVDPCKPETCLNEGSCDEGICKCWLFTSGPKCENVNCSASEGIQCEESGGKCMLNINRFIIPEPYCECPSPKVFDEQLKQCEEYENATCLNGGTSNESGTCNCLPNTDGPKCEIVNCTLTTPKCEESGGKCKYNVSSGTPYCQCPLNKLFRPELNKCQGNCQNFRFPCRNGGVCNKLGNCDCLPLSSGARCEFVNCTFVAPECESSGGRCVIDRSTGDPMCFCGSNKYFYRELGRCTDQCYKHTCFNGGTCFLRCYCLPQTSGTMCEKVDCESIFPNCEESGGECKYDVESSRSYCDCQSPKVYDKEANRCGENKKDACFNGAKINKFGNCGCLKSTSGEKCENINCDSGFLATSGDCEASGGTCKYDIQSENAYCECPANKEFDSIFAKCVGSCNANPCQNGGTCTQLSTMYLCNCGVMHSGDTCETLNLWMVFGFVCLAGSLLILFLGAGIWLKKRHQRNRDVQRTTVPSGNQRTWAKP